MQRCIGVVPVDWPWRRFGIPQCIFSGWSCHTAQDTFWAADEWWVNVLGDARGGRRTQALERGGEGGWGDNPSAWPKATPSARELQDVLAGTWDTHTYTHIDVWVTAEVFTVPPSTRNTFSRLPLIVRGHRHCFFFPFILFPTVRLNQRSCRICLAAWLKTNPKQGLEYF